MALRRVQARLRCLRKGHLFQRYRRHDGRELEICRRCGKRAAAEAVSAV